MNVNDFTQYIAVFAMILAAVNIFNSHINTPFILNPIEDRVKYYRMCLMAVKSNVKLQLSKEQIDNKISHLEWFQRIQKLLTCLYNIIILIVWGLGTFSLLNETIKQEYLVNYLYVVVISSIILILLGVLFRFLLWYCSDSKDIEANDIDAIEQANKLTKNESTVEIR